MNLKFILLSICLALEVTDVKGMGPFVAVITAFGVVDTVLTVKELIEDQDQEVIDILNTILQDSEKSTMGLSDQLYELDTQIRDSTLTVLNEIKMNEINKIIIQIGTSTENVGQVIHSYSGNKTFMINYLVEYIRFLQLENLESSLVEFLDIKVTGTTSLVDIFIEKSKKYQLENTNTLRTSTNKIVHDFFFVMLINIEKGHSLLDLCYKLKAHYLGVSYPSDDRYLERRKQANIDKLTKSWLVASKSTDSLNDYYLFSNLNLDVEYIRFKNVLQTHFVYEPAVKNNCRGSCKNIIKFPFFNDTDCLGTLHYCYDVLGMFETGTMVRSKDPSRIWERYSLGNTWYGRHGMALAGERRVMLNSFKTFNYCDQCRCTCDQSVHRNAVRSFYIGKVRPLRSEYVITGVRFSEYDKVIYLEIEIGQMLPMGFIKPNTVHWQGPPADISLYVIAFNFDFRMFNLDFIKVKTGFLSGFQMFSKDNSLRLRTFSKTFSNFNKGSMSESEETQVDDEGSNRIFYLQDRIPMMMKTKGKIKTRWNRNVFFGTSNQEADAGQSMVPYFDATDITFDLKSPLGGIGFLHFANNDKYAGYIRPIILSLNYSQVTEV